jgi:aryl-alcohol dehydrogenase-like predicted oxidoreductase
MKYQRLGHSGLTVSQVGLGCVSIGRRPDEKGKTVLAPDVMQELVTAALDAGVTLFDTADSYGDSEVAVGKLLSSRRSEVVIATKFGNPLRGALGEDYGARGSRAYIVKAAERSLRRLGTDWIDLYQLHAPDPATPIEETLSALDDLIRAGKVRYVGCSNFSAAQVTEAAWTGRGGSAKFISAQNQYSLIARGVEEELTGSCLTYGLGIIAYCPLANGLLTGKYSPGRLPREQVTLPQAVSGFSMPRVQALSKLADELGISLISLALAGLAAQPGVSSVIAGATKADQVRANVAATGWVPDVYALREIARITAETPSWPQDAVGSWRKPQRAGSAVVS